jgi:hypothetical protein
VRNPGWSPEEILSILSKISFEYDPITLQGVEAFVESLLFEENNALIEKLTRTYLLQPR